MMMKFLERFSVIEDTRRWRNITVWGLKTEGGKYLNYGLASGNITRGKLKIVETGVVGVVEFVSTSTRPTLIPEGTRLIGGRQDRVVNTSVLIPANSKASINVSCVEHNRWEARQGVDHTQFSIAESLVGPTQRSVLKGTTRFGHVADQGRVWESVGETITSLGAGNGQGTLTQAFDAVKKDEEMKFDEKDALKALRFITDANGIAIAIGGELRTIEFFNNSNRLSRIWEHIIGSLFVERNALVEGEMINDIKLRETLTALQTSNWETVKAASVGTETRCSVGNSRASLLQLDDSLIHASLVLA